MRAFYLLLLPLLMLTAVTAAQDIPVKQEDRHTYSFSVGDYVLVQDFTLINAEPTGKNNQYELVFHALTDQKEIDETVNGVLLFEIEGSPVGVSFRQGIGKVTAPVSDPNNFTVTAVDSNISKDFKVQEPVKWYWVLMLIPALLVLYIIFRRIRNRRTV
ncbi:MAG: hypothetical protein LPJ89_02795 [Hymenobacteraceae bacterium]|nr:hypothetical protein [Hymenobacteraceae bacterium]MDX5395722.1 hypothetical protein [Hymenobacteraceae bacterium]MDX5442693.1 hypothetical protein [Hymenobacteraceae bacterium]MDX5511774.1 hypothetical protein [Hymenobacteraceae bacterium]